MNYVYVLDVYIYVQVTVLPEGFQPIAETDGCHIAAFENVSKHMYGIQFHPEVTHSPTGLHLLRNFAVNICKAPTDWSMKNLATTFIEQVL
jgi:GMP synthase (glutamine-hydrolysing)